MKLYELLTETGNNPAPFSLLNPDDEVWEIFAPSLNMMMYLIRGRGRTRKNDTIIVEFKVNGEFRKTGTGNSLLIMVTAKAMLEKYLKGYLQSSDRVVTYGADKAEPSRVKLYNRCAPIVSGILGPAWQYGSDSADNDGLQRYVWTKKESLKEKAVQSTWITDIRHSRDKKEAIMSISNGRRFLIPGVTRAIFDQWTRWPSKGRYYHDRIKGKYQLTRIQ